MKKITAIGEILYDIYPTYKKLGGAPLNFLYHVFKLTGNGNMMSRVGKDILGGNTINFFKENNISPANIQEDHLHPTGITTVHLNSRKEPQFIIDQERAYDYIEKTSELEKIIDEETDCLYFGTLAQRSRVSRETIQSLFNKKTKYFCDLNIRQNFYSKEIVETCLVAANVLKVNLDELKLLGKIFLYENFNITKSAEKLIRQFEIEFLIVTLGENGAMLFNEDKMDHYKPEPFETVDTLGAGDAYASIACIGYMNKWDLSKINKLAGKFAEDICKINGALPHSDEIYEKIKRQMNDE